MAAVTLTTLRARARERADQVNSTFVPDSATGIDALINEGAQELHDLLATKFGCDYLVSSKSFMTVAGQSSYALPSDFLKLLGVDLTVNGQDVDLKLFTFKERNVYKRLVNGALGLALPRYRLEGSVLRLYPAPSGAFSATVHYVPTLQVSTADAAATLDLGALTAGAVDVVLRARAVGVEGNDIRVKLIGDSDPGIGIFREDSGNDVTIHYEAGVSVPSEIVSGLFSYGGGTLLEVVTPSTSSTPISAAFGFTNLSGGAYSVTRGALLELATDMVDFPNGWERYVVLRAAISMQKKEETDHRALESELMQLRGQIEAASENRDAGAPAQAVDVELDFFDFDPRALY
jgi:hypothetical protein